MFRVSKKTISDISKEMIKPRICFVKKNQDRLAALSDVTKVRGYISTLISSKLGRVTVPFLRKKIEQELSLNISARKLLNILKKDLKLSWKKIKNMKPYVNSTKNVKLRRIFAQRYIKVLQSGKTILNFDETTL